MKTTLLAIGVLGLGLCLTTLGGCETSQPGVKDTAGTYSAMVSAAPDKVANAAKKAVEELKLVDVTCSATKVDGKVTARNASNDLVTIEIEQAGENISKVEVRVGVTGDEAVSMQILNKIKKGV